MKTWNRFRRAGLLCALSLLGVEGCKSTPATDSAGGGGATPTSAGDGGAANPEVVFAASLEDVLCSSGAKCCTTSFDKTSCANGVATSFVPTTSSAAEGTYNATAASACLAAITTAVSACDPDTKTLSAAFDTCQTVFPGTKAAGDACMDSTECAAIPNTTRGCDGMCSYAPDDIVVEEGDACTPEVAASGQPQLRCDPAKYLTCNATTSKCEAPNADGAPCSPDSPTCAVGDVCVIDNGVGSCVLGAGDGATCPCATGFGCQMTTTMCEQPCVPVTTSVCKPLVQVGKPCVSGASYLCVATSICSQGGTCLSFGQLHTWGGYCK